MVNLSDRDFLPELSFSFSRSGGPGGQNVNKVSTRVELRFQVDRSILLSSEEKDLLRINLKNRINAEGELIMVSQSERSQPENKEKVIERFYALLAKALTVAKKRVPTRPGRGAREKRLQEKKMQSEKKRFRKDDEPEEG